MAGQLVVQTVTLDFPLNSNISIVYTLREQMQATTVISTQYPQPRPVVFSSEFFSLSDVIGVKVKSGGEVVASNEISLQAFFEANSRDTERWLDVYPFQTSPDRKRRFLPFNTRDSYQSDRPKRLGRIRVKMLLELPPGFSPSDPESPTRSIPKAESPPQRPASREELVQPDPKRPPSRGSDKLQSSPQRAPSRGESPAKRPPSRADSSSDLRREDNREEAKVQSGSRSSDFGELQVDSGSFKIDLQSAIENQARGGVLFPDDPKPDISGCLKCSKLSQIAQVQEDQINQLLDSLWRKHASLLSRVNDPDSESLPILTRFSLGRPDPTTMVAVPLPGGGLSRSESEAYQKILQSLNSQLKILQLAEHEEELLRDKVGISANSYAELQSSLRETQVQMAKLEDGQKAVINGILQEKAEIDRDREGIEKNIKRKMQDIFELTEEFAQLQAEEESYQRSSLDFPKLTTAVTKAYTDYTDTFRQRLSLERDYTLLDDEKTKEITGQLSTIERNRAEISQLHDQVRRLRTQLIEAKTQRESLEVETVSLRDTLAVLESDCARVTDNRAILDSNVRLTTSLGDIVTESTDNWKENEKLYSQAIAAVKGLNDTLTDRKAQTSALLSEAKNVLELRQYRLDGNFQVELVQETEELQSELTVLDGFQTESSRKETEETREFLDVLVKQVAVLADVEVAETLKAAGVATVVGKLKGQLEGLTKEVGEATQQFYRDYYSKGVYTPDQTDPIDVSVSDIVNQAREQSLVPVLRLEPGLYLYGTAVLSVEVKGGTVTVAKGMQSVELGNYVELYGPVEMQKVTLAMNQK